MKAEEFQAKLDTLRTKSGSYPNNQRFSNFMTLIRRNSKCYYRSYAGSGSHTHYTEYSPTCYLNAVGLTYECGNDAPRGGKMGDYIILTPESLEEIKDWREEQIRILEEEKRKDDERNAKMMLARAQRDLDIRNEASSIIIDEEFKEEIKHAFNFKGKLKSVVCMNAFKGLLDRNKKDRIDTDFYAVMRLVISRVHVGFDN